MTFSLPLKALNELAKAKRLIVVVFFLNSLIAVTLILNRKNQSTLDLFVIFIVLFFKKSWREEMTFPLPLKG